MIWILKKNVCKTTTTTTTYAAVSGFFSLKTGITQKTAKQTLQQGCCGPLVFGRVQ
jgi:hypothetical protein